MTLIEESPHLTIFSAIGRRNDNLDRVCYFLLSVLASLAINSPFYALLMGTVILKPLTIYNATCSLK